MMCRLKAARRYNFRARWNDVNEKNTKRPATTTAMPTSQCATSRDQARSAEFSQASASTAKSAPVAS
jgi:hypothetical protein